MWWEVVAGVGGVAVPLILWWLSRLFRDDAPPPAVVLVPTPAPVPVVIPVPNKSDPYGLRITSPGNGETLGPGLVSVSGVFEIAPPRDGVYILSTDGHNYWPQIERPIEFDLHRRTWHGFARVEQSSRISIVTAGRDGRTMFRFCEDVAATERRVHSLRELTSDVHTCDSVSVVVPAPFVALEPAESEPSVVIIPVERVKAAIPPATGLFDGLREEGFVHRDTKYKRANRPTMPAQRPPTAPALPPHQLADEEVFRAVFPDGDDELFRTLQAFMSSHQLGSFDDWVGFLRVVDARRGQANMNGVAVSEANLVVWFKEYFASDDPGNTGQ
jgi:hypothetical protein